MTDLFLAFGPVLLIVAALVLYALWTRKTPGMQPGEAQIDRLFALVEAKQKTIETQATTLHNVFAHLTSRASAATAPAAPAPTPAATPAPAAAPGPLHDGFLR